MFKRGFTLIELLVVVAIIGMLASTVTGSVMKSFDKAKGSHTVQTLYAIEDAFLFKALKDNITTWWDEDDFPSTNSWASYIEDLVNDEIISQFLPIAPDYPNADGDAPFEYAYDSDSDVFVNPTGTACFDHTETFSGNWSQWNNLRGVNVIINPNRHPDSDEFRDVFDYLDQAIDRGDGPYCGKMRHDAFNRGNSSNDRNRHKYYRFGIDFDLVPNI